MKSIIHTNYLKLISCILIPLTIGGIAGIATSSAINDWHLTLQKPWFNPPNYLFGPVWTLLYILMGISLYLTLSYAEAATKNNMLLLFSMQLFLNFIWSFIFFNFESPGWALFEIALLWGNILWMILSFYKVNKLAALLQIPYLLWVSFATLLNAAIFVLN